MILFYSILEEFSECTSSEERFELLIEYAKKNTPISEELKNSSNKIEGCASNAWIFAKKNNNEKIVFFADGESQISKGFLAMMVFGLSGCSQKEILSISESELMSSGIISSLSPSRGNGILSSFKKMQSIVRTL